MCAKRSWAVEGPLAAGEDSVLKKDMFGRLLLSVVAWLCTIYTLCLDQGKLYSARPCGWGMTEAYASPLKH